MNEFVGLNRSPVTTRSGVDVVNKTDPRCPASPGNMVVNTNAMWAFGGNDKEPFNVAPVSVWNARETDRVCVGLEFAIATPVTNPFVLLKGKNMRLPD